MVKIPTIPILDFFDPICASESIDLPITQNGITGIWSGDGIANNQFNAQGLSGEIALTFTPEPGQCAGSNQTSIDVIPVTIPSIQSIGNLCENENPVILDPNQDGIAGSWSGPGIANNIFHPLGLSGRVTLHFQVDPDQCAGDVSRQIEIFELITPDLAPLPAICEDAIPLQLPTEQDKILGNWSGPGVTNNRFDPSDIIGNIQLTFTPLTNQCGSAAIQNILVGLLPRITLNPKDPLCNGSNDGAISTTISGGTAPFKIDWDIDDNKDFDDEGNLADLPAGTYRVEVKDALGCTSQELVELDEPASLKLSTQVTHESSFGANDGKATVLHLEELSPIFIFGTMEFPFPKSKIWDQVSIP